MQRTPKKTTATSNENSPNIRPTCTVSEAAALDVSVGMVYKLLRTRQLDFFKVGRRKLPFTDSIAAYQRANTYRAILNEAGRDEPAPAQPSPRRLRPSFNSAQFLGRRHLR